jgi:hypothetical protein
VLAGGARTGAAGGELRAAARWRERERQRRRGSGGGGGCPGRVCVEETGRESRGVGGGYFGTRVLLGFGLGFVLGKIAR